MTETSKAYADALFSLAMELGSMDETLTALRTTMQVLNAAPGAIDLLASPAIAKAERQAVIDQAFGDTLPEHVLSFLQVLCGNGCIRELPDCLTAYEELYAAAHKLSTAYVTSAVELTQQEQQALLQRLEKRLGRSIQLECSVDPTLLGGMVVQVDGKVIDGSLKHRLDEIKEVMNR